MYKSKKLLLWKKISTKVVVEGKMIAIKHDKVQLPQNNKIIDYIYLSHPGSVIIVPIIHKNETILVEQYRYPVTSFSLEFPAGNIEKGEDSRSAAKRELLEELGFRTNRLTSLGTFYPTNSTSNEKMTAYIAFDFKYSMLQREITETIRTVRVAFTDLEKMIGSGEITDGPTIIAYYLAKRFLEKIKKNE